ncbi:putative ribonuclease H-like domain-containing protein [Tanacetum coccineum]
MAFMSSPSSTNEVNTAYEVSTTNTQVSPASTQVSTASTQVSTANLNDTEEMDLKWQLALLSMRTRSSRRTVNVEETSSKAIVAIDGAGFDWSYMADEEVPTNMALMTFLDSESRGVLTAEFEGYGPKASKSVSEDISNEVKESPDAPFVEELVLDDKLEKKAVFSTVAKIEFVRPKQQEKPVRKPVKYAEMYRLTAIAIKGKGWNMVPRAVLMKTGLRSLNIARHVNTAHPKTIVYSARPMLKAVNIAMSNSAVVNAVRANQGHPQKEDQGYVDSGCSRHMTGNMSYLSNFKEFDGGYVTFGGGAKGGKLLVNELLKLVSLILRMCTLSRSYSLTFLVVHKCVIKRTMFNVLFTDIGWFVLSPDFKLADESRVLLKVPRKNNIYNVNIKNIIPKECLTCLVAKATLDESMLWHRRLGHVNFKTINKLVKENLIRGLPSKRFKNDQTCVACLKGKQHKASCKSKIQNSITQPLFMLHMDLFGPNFVSSLMNKKYCLVVTDDYSRFTWVFFLATKDETSGILKSFIIEIENLVDKKVKIIRCVNGTEFNNRVMSEFCKEKGIKKEFSTAKTPQQNGVAERRIRTLIEAARTMFLKDKPIIAGDGPKWLFDIDVLTKSMNYVPVVACTNSNNLVGTEESIGTGHSSKETGSSQDYILMPLWKDGLLFDSSSKNASSDEPLPSSDAGKKDDEVTTAPLEATHADFFGDETEVDMSNITTTYPVPSTLNTRIYKDHSLDHVIGDVQSSVQTRRMTKTTNEQGFISASYLSVCLFPIPRRAQKAISTKWVYRNRKDERGIVVRNKARLIAQGYTQEKRIDYDDVFALVARIEAIRLFLAYASFKDFVVYQMDVKSAFLYGKIKEDVYVCQPLGFEDLEFLNRVYKVEKVLYGLYQAPRAWYETLSTYLLENGFQRGIIDKTLFIKKVKSDILLVQVYVNDIIFGSTKKELCTDFEKLILMYKGLKIKQKRRLSVKI